MKHLNLITCFLLLSFDVAFAQSRWSIELHGGEVYNVPMPLSIRQDSYPELKLTARYYTEPLTLPVYWDIRFSRWQNDKSWEFEVIHHKLYLENTTAEVQKFNISHGFNMLMVNRGFDKGIVRYRAGAGLVLTHPESKIRGKEFGNTTEDWDMGYYISGPVVNMAISKPISLNGRLFINAEAKTTFAYGSIQVAEGQADVFNLAFHLILGFGYDVIQSKGK